jgi:type II secretory pathway component PulK
MTWAKDHSESWGRDLRSRSSRGRRGVALVIVLLLIVVLAVILSEFIYESRIQTTLMKNHEEKVKARYVAEAGQNAARGLIANISPENETTFNNELIQLFRYTCVTPTLATLGLTSAQEQKQKEEQTDFSSMDGCGQWSLSIPYQLEETPIELEIYDEQARLNLNALMKVGGPQAKDQGPSYTKNNALFNVVFELFRYEAFKHQVQLSDEEIMVMLNELCDYIDSGYVDGSFDEDQMSTFEYEGTDAIISMKNAPLDTVDEIRYLPNMTDELYYAVRPFLTVYPADYKKGLFYDKINFNAAPVEVLYALFRGASYKSGESSMTEQEAMDLAIQTVQNTPETNASTAAGKPTSTATASTVIKYKRTVPPACQSNALCNAFLMPDGQNPRFYRVQSTAITPTGLQTAITKVIMINRQTAEIVALYYLED